MKISFSKSFILLALYFALISVLIIFGIIPAITKLTLDRRELNDGSAKLAAYQEKISNLSKYNKDKTELDTVEKVVNGLLPQDKNSSDFVVKMEALGNEQAIKFTTFTITEPTAKATAKTPTEDDTATTSGSSKKTASETADTAPAATTTTPKSTDIAFATSFKTEYLNFKTFIEKTESFSRFMTISSISISGYDKDTGNLQCNIKGNIYYGK